MDEAERSASERVIATIRTALDGLAGVERSGLSAEVRLGLVAAARREHERLGALLAVLIAEADVAGASVVARGTPLRSWLALSGATSTREAAAMVFAARDLVRSDRVRDAALAGRLRVRQARGIVRALEGLPATVTAVQRQQVERRLIAEAQSRDAHALAGMGGVVLAQVAPESVPDQLAELEGRRRRAEARRGLRWVSDGRGSVLLRGSLPTGAAASLVRLIDAYVESERRAGRDHAVDRRDPLVGVRSLEQRRADALVALVAAHVRAAVGPGLAGDRPRIVVTLAEADLRRRAEQAGLLNSGEAIGAGELRRLCCDADLTPAVLGAASEVLDVGRTVRLVTAPLRRALSVRDGGCVFPGCGAADECCDAHHVVPWWDGGLTAVANLVLVCPHHHGLVEPPRFFDGVPPDRWQIRIDDHGLPEVIPSARVDPERRPLPARHRQPQRAETA